MLCGSAAQARQTLVARGDWAAFRDGDRCWAVAEPVRGARPGTRPSAAVAMSPGRRWQVSFRLPYPAQRARLVTGGRQFALVVRGTEAWPVGDDAAIAAMRAAPSMTLHTENWQGVWTLAGAPTAIDAARLACARG